VSELHEREIGLSYPMADHPLGPRPGDAEVFELRPGVLWLRMPIPIPGLDYINLWLVRDGEGWTVIDTGFRSSKTQGLWEQVFERYLGGLPITRILCTHFHPDHLGLAGWLHERWQAPLWMTLGEWSFARMLSLDALPQVPPEVLSFYQRVGFEGEALEKIKASGFGNFRKAVGEIPRYYHRMVGGDLVRIGEHDWRVIIGRGHSPEHASLYCADLNLLISGDQVLPRISPHIGVYPGEPDACSLTLYLRSFDAFADLPADVWVLPAHGDVFIGLHARIAYLKRHHQERLDILMEAMDKPMTVLETLPLLFKRDIKDHITLAAGEAMAHLHHLMAAGMVERRVNAKGVYEYSRREMAQAAQ